MKTFISISLLTIVMLISWISTDTLNHSKNRVQDDEQTGLRDQIVIRFSHVVAENTPKGLAAQKFAQLVESESNGKVKVEVYPNSILYSDGEEVDALVNGDIQMIAPTFSKMTEYAPKWKVLDLPFLFENDEHVERVFNGKIGKDLLQKLDHKNMLGLTFWSNGFKQMTSNERPLLNPEDFQGLHFRVMPGTVIQRQFALLNAKTTAQPFNNVYRSLELHELDGQENTISNIYSKGLYKVQSHLTLSNHAYLGYAVIINKQFWGKLTPTQQNQINSALSETTKWIQEEAKKMNEQQFEEIQQNSSLQLHTLNKEQQKAWKDRFAPLYQELKAEIGSTQIQSILNE
ncbi:DctP family TRAP transporter solute-binding subunit [Bacillus marasmi]|uniref:DctP family TRAP transporter solute-binding subunit n=1 Tax=Bacillus marasmi TaxID=1926279 RepID=UPI0011CAB14B|nr:DctP family TRAP transporter solute-binding subunit [Bacillus marasmi]